MDVSIQADAAAVVVAGEHVEVKGFGSAFYIFRVTTSAWVPTTVLTYDNGARAPGINLHNVGELLGAAS